MAARPLTPLVDDATDCGPVEWWRLEIRSFDDAPNTRLSLAVLGPKEAWTKEAGRPALGGCLMTLLFVFAIVAPAVAAAAMFRWAMTGSGSVPLVFAGLLTLLSLIITACSEISLARRPRAVSMSILLRI